MFPGIFWISFWNYMPFLSFLIYSMTKDYHFLISRFPDSCWQLPDSSFQLQVLEATLNKTKTEFHIIIHCAEKINTESLRLLSSEKAACKVSPCWWLRNFGRCPSFPDSGASLCNVVYAEHLLPFQEYEFWYQLDRVPTWWTPSPVLKKKKTPAPLL